MKKIFYSILSIALICASISCSSNDYMADNMGETDNAEKAEIITATLNIPEQYKVIGEMHNKGVEAGFKVLREYYEKQANTRSAQKDSVIKLSKEECLKIACDGLTDFASKNLDNYSEIMSQISSAKNGYTRAANEISMSSQVAKYVERIKEVLVDEPGNVESLIKGLNAINNDAAKELSEAELIAVYAGTSTCYKSYLYWKENYKKWILLLNNPELLENFTDEQLNKFTVKNGKLVSPVQTRGWWDDAWGTVSETWDSTTDYVSDWWSNGGGKEVVLADAGSAAVGAMEGAIAGAVVGGVGAGPGAVANGLKEGAKGSIVAAIVEWGSRAL